MGSHLFSGGGDRRLFSEFARGTRRRGRWGFRGDGPRLGAAGGELLCSVRLIDLYEGEHVPARRKARLGSTNLPAFGPGGSRDYGCDRRIAFRLNLQ